ncbi:YciI family protein [Actinobacteria bacterium YIM 96077]|uniref:YciI family protein n=1 Tax=Phytoactinopolyspora halophila TaxID=1981511 RepID=A0A329R4L5_9ACTN|nr:YciI family protein [Phytoactinopolyspora halophila]AYY11900.1 YciI family protein [Actinobacteria bacterium YIM 96077]RAW18866.1 YciI family protein [Phytoactinopolyspora halophila]
MRVLVMVKANEGYEAGTSQPSEELMAAMAKYNEELEKAGVLLAANGLQPSSEGARVEFSGTRRTVVDGPFSETKELVAGFWLWQVASMDEAIEWVKRCPNPDAEDGVVEIRPVAEAADFDDLVTPEIREQLERIDMRGSETATE